MLKNIRILVILLGLIAVLYKFGSGVSGMNKIRTEGQTMLLKLRPIDPRAFMKGDYMALRYHQDTYPEKRNSSTPSEGVMILLRGAHDVAKFSRFDNGTALTPKEIRVRYYKGHRDNVDIGAARYYFQEGTAKIYEPAKYGVFKVSQSGYIVLVDLADKDFNILAPTESNINE